MYRESIIIRRGNITFKRALQAWVFFLWTTQHRQFTHRVYKLHIMKIQHRPEVQYQSDGSDLKHAQGVDVIVAVFDEKINIQN